MTVDDPGLGTKVGTKIGLRYTFCSKVIGNRTLAVSVDIDALNQLIREGAPNALDILAALPSPCVVDAEGQSPVNVAIEANNEEIFFLLVDADGALEFAPAVHSSDDAKLIKTIYQTEGIDDIDDAEHRVLEAAGVPPYWQRTPLLQACRYQNRKAIRELIARGAKLTAKDLVGETPFSLCIQIGGSDLAQHFIESCVVAKKPVPLSEEVLRNLCGDAGLYKQAIAHGLPNATAKRFMFNLACATLDRLTIEKMLDDGFDLNSAITNSTNPVVELVTSRLAWMYKASQWTEFAAGYAHYNGHPDTTVVKVSNNPGPADLTYGQTLALHADLNQSVCRKERNPKFMSIESLHERLALLSLLFEKGLDVAKVKQKLDFSLTADVVSSNEPDFVAALISAGFSLAPDGSMDVEHAIEHGCFDMVAPLEQCGHKLKQTNMIPSEMLEKYRQWQSSEGSSPPAK